jgi:hypothetical protein
MDIEIRPRRGRHTKPLVTLALVLGLFALCGAGKVVDRASLHQLHVRPLALATLIVMGVVPFALLVAISVLNSRNVALRTEGGQLIATEWTGRVVTVPAPGAARVYPIGTNYGFIGELLVIGGRSGNGAAAVIAPSWWSDGDLQALLHALRLRDRPEQQIAFSELTKRYPDARLPISVRRPWLFSGFTVLAVIAYLGVMINLLLTF